VLKLSSNVSDVFLKVLKLIFEVSECKPLPNSRLLPGSRMLSTTPSYASSFMKPVRGEKPPTASSSRSHALRSERSSLRVAEAANQGLTLVHFSAQRKRLL